MSVLDTNIQGGRGWSFLENRVSDEEKDLID